MKGNAANLRHVRTGEHNFGGSWKWEGETWVQAELLTTARKFTGIKNMNTFDLVEAGIV